MILEASLDPRFVDTLPGMRLTLADPDPMRCPAFTSVVVGDEPLRIGRAADNDWIFPQDTVSRYQAVVRRVFGFYFIENRSARCPVAVGAPDRYVRQGDCEVVPPGQSIWIDAREIRADLAPKDELSSDVTQPEDGSKDSASSVYTENVLSLLIKVLDEDTNQSEMPTNGPDAGAALSEGWWQNDAPEAATDSSAGEQVQTARQLLIALCEGAGIDPARAALTPTRARHLGTTLRAMTTGVVQLLQARRAVRNELRLEHTRIHARANNPFKMSNDELEVLNDMFAGPRAGNMEVTEALEEAFAELLDHQVATVDALRSAFAHLLHQLGPEAVEKAIPAPSRWWQHFRSPDATLGEVYRALHQRWMQDPEWAYDRLFGAVLARRYEEQVLALKAMRARGRRLSRLEDNPNGRSA
jgi:predicted component of type VI protein secretion system